MSTKALFREGILAFNEHYTSRFKQQVQANTREIGLGTKFELTVEAPLLKPGNFPYILHHGEATPHVVILTHGLSDSPYYVSAIGKRFFDLGCNVIFPLLPAHGLKDPNEAMEDEELDKKWKETIDNAVYAALRLGDRVTLGGFSTGGALSLNKVLRSPEEIGGGLLLFSAALDLGSIIEGLGQFGFIQSLTRLIDGRVAGIGRDPYRYPTLPHFACAELCQIIADNESMLNGTKIRQRTFAAHSIHDETVKMPGLLKFMEHHVEKGMALILSENITHSQLVLEKDVALDLSQTLGSTLPPRANPKFNWMMDYVIRFFKEEIRPA